MNGPDTTDQEVSGYLHSLYAESLCEFGSPFELPHSKGWLLRRQIPDSTDYDAMGCYPLFSCQDWSQLPSDLEELTETLVNVTLVTSPFGNYEPAHLKTCFPDLFIPFKNHFVVDLSRPPSRYVDPHHRRNARRALAQMRTEICTRPLDYLADWLLLYAALVKRHKITGIAAFSKASFEKQLIVPGITAFRAVNDGQTAGMLLWYIQGNVAYYHLGAYSDRGYELGSSFALFSHAIDYFAQCGLRWLNLGAGAGTDPSVQSGLDRFKKGWATGVRPTYLCGKITNRKKHDKLVAAKRVPPTSYFPAYRLGEFS